jgi:hypothetical protein
MKLKKAIEVKINYQSRESIKPILAGVGIALALSACSQTVGQEPIIKDERKNIDESANVAGRMPVHIPPSKEHNASNIHQFKIDIHQIEKEIIVPVLPAGIPVPKSK